MGKTLKDSAAVGVASVVSGMTALGLLGANEPPVNPGPGAWFSTCVSISACPGFPCSVPDDQGCTTCEFQFSRMDCEFAFIGSCTRTNPPGDDPNCGTRWVGFCLSGNCFFNSIWDVDGICPRKWCN